MPKNVDETVISKTDARQGVRKGMSRVLIISTLAAVVILVGLLLYFS